MNEKTIKIENLGWNNFFETNRLKLGLDFFQIARIILECKGGYKIKNLKGEYFAKITGKRIFKALSREDYPAVGDWVIIQNLDEKKAIIQEILPRKTVMKRKYNNKSEIQIIATNIDVAFVIESVDRDFNLNRFERYFSIAQNCNIEPVIILNKIDLISEEELNLKLAQIKNRFKNVVIITTSILNEEKMKELKKQIVEGKTYCFLGSSGVGKSSLINKLLNKSKIKTKKIGSHSNRGKHTTTAREMYFLENGGIVIDNPGMREIGMTNTNLGIDNFFDEITSLSQGCKFADCTHTQEPDCAVLSALKSGKLDRDKYFNYIALKKEASHYEMSEFEKKEKNRNFGKFLKKAKNELKKHKQKDYKD